jgi:opacity protein-like surface antigen
LLEWFFEKTMAIIRRGWVLVIVLVMGYATVQADQRRLVLSLGAGEKYNDNIFFTGDGEIDDFITMLSGGMAFVNRTERLDLSLSGRAINQDYADNDDLDGLDQYYKSRIGYWLAPHLKATLDGSFSRDTQPDRDIDVTGLVLNTATRDTQQYGAGIQYDPTDITSAFFSYQYRDQDYESSQYSDYNYHQVGLEFTHRLDKHIDNTTGRLNFRYAHYNYPATRLDYYAATTGFLHRLTELWHLQIDVGARYTESKFRLTSGEQANNGWGGVGSLEFGYQGRDAAASLTMSHDVRAASGLDGSVERDSAVLDFNYRFAEKVRAGIAAGYFRNIADSGDLALNDTDENTCNLRPYLRAGLTDNLSLDVSYTYSQIDNRIDGVTRERSLAQLKLVWDYPVVE